MSSLDIKCPHCARMFTRKDNMLRHVNEKRCKSTYSQIKTEQHEIEKKFAELEERTNREIAELKEQKTKEIAELKELTNKELEEIKKAGPTQVNQVLQVICITGNDNYLDMLTERMGNFGDAIEYIKDCALSDISGDCKLIEKIYMCNGPTKSEKMYYTDRSRNKIMFYNENLERVVESKISMGKKLANNLQNSYLKGINHLINRNLDDRLNPNKFLEDYDLLAWNKHIYDLSDTSYQRKIINHLNIPLLSDIDKKSSRGII